jgi:aspartate/glutamate racemase
MESDEREQGLGVDVEAVCTQRLNDTGVPWSASTNFEEAEARSCRQAVKVRSRVGSGGNGGIPLWAELKSFVGAVVDGDGRFVEAFAAHTRANTDFDHTRLLEVLGYDASAHSVEELAGEDGDDGQTPDVRTWFGLVNPFDVDLVISDLTRRPTELADIRQILDDTIALDGGIPDTMTTNLGARTRAMELAPADLIWAVQAVSPQAVSASVSVPSPIWLGLAGAHPKHYWLQLPPASGPKIGILTGNGPDSGRALWQDLLESLRTAYELLPDVLMPAVVVNSVPAMGLSMELVQREEAVERAVLGGITELLDVGCELITIACNTTIYFRDHIVELCRQRGAEFVSIAEASVRALENARSNAQVVGLVGIGPVIDIEGQYSGYRAPLEEHGFEVVPCDGLALAYSVKSKGDDDPRLITEFRSLMHPLPKVVILALTEVSMLYRRHIAKSSTKRPDPHVYIDPLGELGRELAYRYLVRGYLESEVCQTFDRAYVEEHVNRLLTT